MTVGQLKMLLEDYDDDTEVRTMTQPNWPFECEIAGLTERSAFGPVDHDHEVDYDDPNQRDCVFIVEGNQICYGCSDAWQAC